MSRRGIKRSPAGLNRAVFQMCLEPPGTPTRNGYITHFVDVASRLLRAERMTIFFPGEGGLVSRYAAGVESPIHLAMGEGVAGQVFMTGRARIVNEPRGEPHFSGRVDEATGYRTENLLVVPVSIDGRTAGVLEFLNRRGGFRARDLKTAHEIARQLGVRLARIGAMETLERSNRALQDLDRLRTEFVANVSHELRTPLMAMSSALELVEDSLAGKLNARDAELLRVVRRNISRLERQVRDILYLSRSERGKLFAAVSSLNLRPLVESAVEQFRAAFHTKRFQVVVELGQDLPEIIADPGLVDQALGNFLANAGKFTPEGGTIGVEVRREGAGVRLCVWDTGPGVPEEEREKIFERFYRAPGQGVTPGTGIGLAIVSEVAKQHGGRAWMEPVPGRGSRFFLYLPLKVPTGAGGG